MESGHRPDPLSNLLERLHDQRSKRVVFLSHCLLNENTRYLGGACRGGCVPEIVQRCIAADLGIVQMPCPEQRAWGGVLKRRLLYAYGLQHRHPLAYRLRRLLLPLALWYTRSVYRRLARESAGAIEDYLTSGFSVAGIVGVDGSPSCALESRLDLRLLEPLLSLSPTTMTVAHQNALLRRAITPGKGLFIAALQRELKRRHLEVPFQAHDLLSELDGQASNVRFNAQERPD